MGSNRKESIGRFWHSGEDCNLFSVSINSDLFLGSVENHTYVVENHIYVVENHTYVVENHTYVVVLGEIYKYY